MSVSTSLLSLSAVLSLAWAPLMAATVYQNDGGGTIYDPPQTQVSVTQAQVQFTQPQIRHGPSGVQVTPGRAVYTAPQITVSEIDRRRSSNQHKVVNHTTYTWNDSHTTHTSHALGQQSRAHYPRHRSSPQPRHGRHYKDQHHYQPYHHQQRQQRVYRRGYRHGNHDGYRNGYQDGWHDRGRSQRSYRYRQPSCSVSVPLRGKHLRGHISLRF